MQAACGPNIIVAPACRRKQGTASAEAATSQLASLWLCCLAALLAGSLFSTVVLVGWPIVVRLAVRI